MAGVSTLIGEQDLTGLLSRWIEQHSPSVLILITARLTAGFQADQIANDLVDEGPDRKVIVSIITGPEVIGMDASRMRMQISMW